MTKPTEGNYLTPPGASFRHLESITKSDSTVLNLEAVYVGGAGDLVVENGNGQEVTFANALGWFFVRVTKVKAATTATDVVGAR